ncbi:hypothetical protein [Lachnoanaerobaculum saburreum]|jgi:hypothetical protein|uniref:Uncharacterized protein n=1 Tax=Lachnoanaerobaculum saburreum DSM 3986 TaxID=887325 RepID=E6LLI6_9FIRM|nr:hypothetical protein [Lachnoanaerobaculum saburreum]EFU77312.1 hypothetical protein HMPREF0381_0821 [Lachnoanaerobaculum saburreum DSM 3986]
MQLDLDTDVLKVRDQSNKEALTDQYPGINILTKESREKLEKLEIDKNRRYDELINNLTFSVNNEQLPKELVRLKMSELNIFTSKADYYNLTYKNEKTISPIFSIIFLIFMGSVGLLFALNRGKRRKYAH